MALKRNKQGLPSHDTASNAVAAALVIVFLLLTWNGARSGLASLLTTSAAISNEIASANAAVRFNASNPDAHYVRATILMVTDLPAAITEFEQAALARPDDY